MENNSIEEAANDYCDAVIPISPVRKEESIKYFTAGAKSDAAKEYWQNGLFTKKEVKSLILKYLNDLVEHRKNTVHSFKGRMLDINDWFEINKNK